MYWTALEGGDLGAQFLALDMECHLFNGKGAQTCAGG